MRMKRNGWYPLCLVFALVALTGCGTDAEQKEIELLSPAEAVVDVETAMNRDLYKLTTRNAEVAPYTEELTFAASGRISALHVEVGSVVKKGEVLAEQEEDGVYSVANNALDKYLTEKKAYVDTMKAVERKLATGLTKEERELQELQKKQAEELWIMQEPILWKAWEEARARLGSGRIVAPYDGVVTACLKEGTSVAAGQPVIALADTERPYIIVNSYLTPTEYRNYEKVYGFVNGEETALTYVEELMEEEGAYTYYSVDDLKGAKLGDFALVCMVGDYHADVLSVPKNSVYKDSSGSYVYVQEDGAKVRWDVVTGYTGDVYVEIEEGLQEGDKVYVKK